MKGSSLALALLSLASSPAVMQAGEEAVGTGSLFVRTPQGYRALPVVSMEVDLDVTGILVRGTVRQRFASAMEEPIGAVYMFPLPERAAVDGMRIRAGDRTIDAVVRERETARREFEEARASGRQASLLEQHRPNLFRMQVARIEPGETVEVTLTYLQELDVEEGRMGLAFPLTYTPRYRPARSPAAVEPETPPAAPDVFPAFCPADSAHAPRVTLEVRLDAGLPVAEVRSISHDVRTAALGEVVRVRPATGEIAADRDFLLSWTVERGDEPQATLWIEEREDGRYGLLMLAPPSDRSPGAAGLATDTVFVIDTSGSMAGPSIDQARWALGAAIARLTPQDAFGLIRFDDTSRAYRTETAPGIPREIESARDWVEGLEAEGGTEILGALRRGLDLLEAAPVRGEPRLVLITDGAVSNEAELLAELAPRLDRVRLHVVGIGAAPNRWLMRELARTGRGACVFIQAGDGLLQEMERFLDRIDRPVLADLELGWPDGAPLEVYPRILPDLHAGEFAFVSLRLPPGEVVSDLVLSGRSGGGWVERQLVVHDGLPPGSGVAVRWAHAKVAGQLDGLHRGLTAEQVRPAVVEVALAFGLVTPFTSLVAVESRRSGGEPGPLLPVAAASTPGSELPLGGTSGPLRQLVAVGLFALAAFVLALGRRVSP